MRAKEGKITQITKYVYFMQRTRKLQKQDRVLLGWKKKNRAYYGSREGIDSSSGLYT